MTKDRPHDRIASVVRQLRASMIVTLVTVLLVLAVTALPDAR